LNTRQNGHESPHDPAQFEIMRMLEERPGASQREVASSIGVSLGKANHCLRALIAKGLVKAENYRKADNKLAYLYLLTPSGIAEKAALTKRFLERKVREYEDLRVEIERLKRESAKSPAEMTPVNARSDERVDAS
jgi:EPS-associated MarR family transcriptional regulator